ncbi:hypothetical protein [Longimicrobium sp.]|uniref:hypothetical protein n=1 Tax=Longimicrobium sp. TaxID=2029185 RepID=UPI002ED88EFE
MMEDANGRSSYIVPRAGALLGINTAASSAELGFYRLKSDRPIFGGASVQAATKEGLSPIFGSGDARSGVAIEALIGLKGKLGGTGARTPSAAVGIRARRAWSEIALANLSTPASPIDKEIRFSTDLALHLSLAIPKSLLPRSMIVAVAGGRRTLDNYTDLTKVSVRTVSTAQTTDGRTVEIATTEEARTGSYSRQHHNFVDVDATMSLLPNASIRGFGRFLPGREEGSVGRNSGGFDIGIHKRGGDAILDRRVGLVFQVNENLPGTRRKDFVDRISIGLVVNAIPVARALLNALSQ